MVDISKLLEEKPGYDPYVIIEKKRSVIDDIIEREKERKEDCERREREERDYRIRSGFFNGYR